MKKIFGFLILLFLTTAFSFNIRNDENKMQSFRWLEGAWKMPTKNGGSIIENWKFINDTILWGQTNSYSANGTWEVLENLKLVDDNGTYFYVSKVHGQNNNTAVWFKITSHSDTGFVAEKPDHDFPKRITYQLINKDSIHAFIDGGPSMPGKKSDFYYSRYKN